MSGNSTPPDAITTLRCHSRFTACGCLALCDGHTDTQVSPSAPAPGHSPCSAPWEPQAHAPMSSANPPTGRRHVPVTNCNSRILFSLSISLTTYNKDTAEEWDPCHPNACSSARHGAPSCTMAPTMNTPCLQYSPGQSSPHLHPASSGRSASQRACKEQLCSALYSFRAISNPLLSWPAQSSTTQTSTALLHVIPFCHPAQEQQLLLEAR